MLCGWSIDSSRRFEGWLDSACSLGTQDPPPPPPPPGGIASVRRAWSITLCGIFCSLLLSDLPSKRTFDVCHLKILSFGLQWPPLRNFKVYELIFFWSSDSPSRWKRDVCHQKYSFSVFWSSMTSSDHLKNRSKIPKITWQNIYSPDFKKQFLKKIIVRSRFRAFLHPRLLPRQDGPQVYYTIGSVSVRIECTSKKVMSPILDFWEKGKTRLTGLPYEHWSAYLS